jgi:hypothetical protein
MRVKKVAVYQIAESTPGTERGASVTLMAGTVVELVTG